VRVLIVDDLLDNRELYASYLELSGVDVEQARDGAEALAAVDTKTPDVIVMDLAMPRVDGWEATRRIKSNPRTKHVYVIILTARSEQDDLDRARLAGADEICMKPCLPSELLRRIELLSAKVKITCRKT
jgi:CheY-like chemotaxis protein